MKDKEIEEFLRGMSLLGMKTPDRVIDYLDEKAKEIGKEFILGTLCRLGVLWCKEKHPMISPVEQLFYIEWKSRLHETEGNGNKFTLDLQYQDESTGKYILDFIINFEIDAYMDYVGKIPLDTFKTIKTPRLGIEIDGHEWHEKTKEQAQRDKTRERFLVSHGWRLLRFTGSEIYKNTEKCMDEVLKISYELRNEYFNKLEELKNGSWQND